MLGENKAERGNRHNGADIFEWMTRGCPGNDPLEKRTERYLLRRHGKHTNLRVFILAVSSAGKITLYPVSFHKFYIQQ